MNWINEAAAIGAAVIASSAAVTLVQLLGAVVTTPDHWLRAGAALEDRISEPRKLLDPLFGMSRPFVRLSASAAACVLLWVVFGLAR